MELTVYTDGASRENPGESASGYLICEDGTELLQCFYNGKKTNNEAEYLAVISAIEKLIELKKTEYSIVLYSDSKLIVNQLNGNYKIKKPELIELYKRSRLLSKRFFSFSFNNLPRENKNISKVDTALNLLLDELQKSGIQNKKQKNLSNHS